MARSSNHSRGFEVEESEHHENSLDIDVVDVDQKPPKRVKAKGKGAIRQESTAQNSSMEVPFRRNNSFVRGDSN